MRRLIVMLPALWPLWTVSKVFYHFTWPPIGVRAWMSFFTCYSVVRMLFRVIVDATENDLDGGERNRCNLLEVSMTISVKDARVQSRNKPAYGGTTI